VQQEEILPVNIGNPREMTIKEFASIIQSKIGANNPSGKPVNIIHLKSTKDDPRKRKPDISKAKRVLGWEPKVKTEDGLDLTIKYFQNEIARLGEIDIVGPLARRLKEHKRLVVEDEEVGQEKEMLD
jgi:dTDP-glucose 4,6-dehydratase|tara:strand:- start:110 stop:490 length:381 start_codon:yes stop_codon:yes gene_type:complete